MIRSMQRVLEWREKKCRLALARVTRTIAKRQVGMQALDQVLTTVEAQIAAARQGRFAASCTVAALIELEQNAQNLQASLERLVALKQQAERSLAELIAQQRQHARLWQRCETRLAHVQSIAQRERAQQATRAAESDEETFTEQRFATGERR